MHSFLYLLSKFWIWLAENENDFRWCHVIYNKSDLWLVYEHCRIIPDLNLPNSIQIFIFLKLIYYSLIRSRIDYGTLSWAKAHQTHLQQIRVITQRKGNCEIVRIYYAIAHTSKSWKRMPSPYYCLDVYTIPTRFRHSSITQIACT